MNNIEKIKKRLKENAKKLCLQNQSENRRKKHKSAFVWDDVKMNFFEPSFLNINKNEKWLERLKKQHTKVPDSLEMQSSNSSDALLMNIFCYPKILKWKGVRKLLKIEDKQIIEFGKRFEIEGQFMAEVDMKIGNHIFEAKLTESNFTEETIEKIENYKDFVLVFESDLLLKNDTQYFNYQLIRNILVAYYYNFSFTMICDESRTDLIRSIFEITKAVKIEKLRKRINFITWQEIVDVCGKELKNFIENKYF